MIRFVIKFSSSASCRSFWENSNRFWIVRKLKLLRQLIFIGMIPQKSLSEFVVKSCETSSVECNAFWNRSSHGSRPSLAPFVHCWFILSEFRHQCFYAIFIRTASIFKNTSIASLYCNNWTITWKVEFPNFCSLFFRVTHHFECEFESFITTIYIRYLETGYDI